jgi:hypothetical protein
VTSEDQINTRAVFSKDPIVWQSHVCQRDYIGATLRLKQFNHLLCRLNKISDNEFFVYLLGIQSANPVRFTKPKEAKFVAIVLNRMAPRQIADNLAINVQIGH